MLKKQFQKKSLHITVEALCWHYLFSRPVARQLSSAYMCLTSVFGMAASPSAASSGSSEGAACAAVGEGRWRSVAEDIRRAPQTETDGPLLYEKTSYFRRRFMLAIPIFPGSRPPSIVGADELNFCVRDGNRWTLIAINTNFIWMSFDIFYIKALRLR